MKQAIADNIAELRKEMHLTQAELAEKMGYTDKAISKWERAESIPDIVTLKEFADLSGVTLDYLIKKEHVENRAVLTKQARNNRLVISLLAAAGGLADCHVAICVSENFRSCRRLEGFCRSRTRYNDRAAGVQLHMGQNKT